ncbi:hypothetical protein [Actinoplanes sp. NPDC089786]|uniref:hypothetical protein n=1 Tax=Actinoplanes sp. NPDC089786 TaxID=3155185 RepID=UPI00342604A6
MIITGEDQARAGVADPDRFVRAVAVRACLRAGWLSDEELRSLAASLPRSLRGLLSRWASPGAADVLVEEVRSRYGDREAARLLPRCGDATVRRLLPSLDDLAGPNALAAKHPAALLDHLEARLAVGDRAELWNRFAAAVLRIGDDRVLDLVERFAPDGVLPGRPVDYGRYAGRHPGRVARLLAAPGRLDGVTLPRRLARRLAVLPDDELIPFGDRPELLAALPPSRRGAVFRAAREDPGRPAPNWPAVLAVLPHRLRAEEARRSGLRDIAGFLPWEQVRELAAVNDGDSGVRLAAYRNLLGSARLSRDRTAVAEALEGLSGRLRNEIDPVRRELLRAVGDLVPLITAAAAPSLARLVTDTLEAPSTSTGTLEELVEIPLGVRHDPALRDWALDAVARIVRAGGFDVVLALRDRGDAELVDRLAGWVEAGAAHGDHDRAPDLAWALRRAGWPVERLRGWLADLALHHPDTTVAKEAIEQWLADPATRDDRAARLLAADPTAITQEPVWAVVRARRTDLVPANVPPGRFRPAPARRWTPAVVRGTERWRPEQRAAFVRLQGEVVADADEDLAIRVRAVRAAARAGGRELVESLVDHPDVRIAEAAVGALGADSLGVIRAQLDTDRARVAVWALARVARDLPPAEAVGVLADVVRTSPRIAARKEAVRLLGDAVPVLAEVFRRDGQHPDVRAAVVATVRQRLDQELSWDLLTEAARDGIKPAWPGEIAERHRPRYARVVALTGDEDAMLLWMEHLTGLGDLLFRRMTNLERRCPPFVGAVLRHPDADAFRLALRRLAELDRLDAEPGGPAADRPARRRLTWLADRAVTWAVSAGAGVDRAPLIAAARALGEVPAFAGTAARLLAAALPLRTPELIELCTPRPLLAVVVAGVVAERARKESLEPAILRASAAVLGGRGDLAGGLIAVALARAGERHRWAEPFRGMLLDLRQHPDPEVRGAALEVSMVAR